MSNSLDVAAIQRQMADTRDWMARHSFPPSKVFTRAELLEYINEALSIQVPDKPIQPPEVVYLSKLGFIQQPMGKKPYSYSQDDLSTAITVLALRLHESKPSFQKIHALLEAATEANRRGIDYTAKEGDSHPFGSGVTTYERLSALISGRLLGAVLEILFDGHYPELGWIGVRSYSHHGWDQYRIGICEIDGSTVEPLLRRRELKLGIWNLSHEVLLRVSPTDYEKFRQHLGKVKLFRIDVQVSARHAYEIICAFVVRQDDREAEDLYSRFSELAACDDIFSLEIREFISELLRLYIDAIPPFFRSAARDLPTDSDVKPLQILADFLAQYRPGWQYLAILEDRESDGELAPSAISEALGETKQGISFEVERSLPGQVFMSGYAEFLEHLSPDDDRNPFRNWNENPISSVAYVPSGEPGGRETLSSSKTLICIFVRSSYQTENFGPLERKIVSLFAAISAELVTRESALRAVISKACRVLAPPETDAIMSGHVFKQHLTELVRQVVNEEAVYNGILVYTISISKERPYYQKEPIRSRKETSEEYRAWMDWAKQRIAREIVDILSQQEDMYWDVMQVADSDNKTLQTALYDTALEWTPERPFEQGLALLLRANADDKHLRDQLARRLRSLSTHDPDSRIYADVWSLFFSNAQIKDYWQKVPGKAKDPIDVVSTDLREKLIKVRQIIPLIREADSLLQNRQYARAYEKYLVASRLYPDNAYLHRHLARCRLGLGDLDQAIYELEKAKESDPFHADTYRLFGDAYTGLGNFEEAVRSYDYAATLDDRSSVILVQHALAIVKRERAEILKTANSDPKYVVPSETMAEISRLFMQAREFDEEALPRSPEDGEDVHEKSLLEVKARYYAWLGRVYEVLDKRRNALSAYHEAHLSDPANGEYEWYVQQLERELKLSQYKDGVYG